MIQFNLLPDVKKQYIQTKRTKRLIMSMSLIACAASLGVLLLVFSYVQIAQKKSINDLTEDIATEIAAVKSINGIDEILTIQNQMSTLPGLHQKRPATSRIFEYLNKVTPQNVFIGSVKLDIGTSSLEISGTAESLAAINTYVDTLKFATYSSGDVKDEKPFSNVITSLSRNSENANYTVKFNFVPVLFDNTVVSTISVPKTVTTRSTLGLPVLESSNDLFKENPTTEDGGGQ